MLAVHDVGQCMNRTLAEGQVEGGAQMSLGMALCEEMVYDKKGQLRDVIFQNTMINAPDMPPVKSLFIEKEDRDGLMAARASANFGGRCTGTGSC